MTPTGQKWKVSIRIVSPFAGQEVTTYCAESVVRNAWWPLGQRELSEKDSAHGVSGDLSQISQAGWWVSPGSVGLDNSSNCELLTPDNAEPCAAVPSVRLVLVAFGGTGTERPEAPGTASNGTESARVGAGGIVSGRRGMSIFPVPI